MAVHYDSSVSSFFYGSTDIELSDYITSIDGLPGKKEFSDVTTFGQSGHKWNPSLQNVEFTISVLYSEDTTYGTNTTFGALRTATSAKAFKFYPAVTTGQLISGSIWVDDYNITSQVGNAITAKIHCKVDGVVTIA